MKPLALVCSILLLAACGPKQSDVAPYQYQYQTPVNIAEFEPYGIQGTGTINGQGFLKTMSGDVKYAAGNPVVLVPSTSYTREWFQVGVVEGKLIPSLDLQVGKYIRTAIADAEGRFTFNNLPAGRYYVATDINWYSSANTLTGGTAYAIVDLKDGQTLDVVATRP